MAKQQSQLQMLLIKFHSWLMTSRTTDQLFSSAADGPLSTRELGVLQLVMRGKSYREIATDCGISERTVKFHMSNISENCRSATPSKPSTRQSDRASSDQAM